MDGPLDVLVEENVRRQVGNVVRSEVMRGAWEAGKEGPFRPCYLSCLVVEDDVGSGEPQAMMKVRDESLGGGAAALVFSVGTFTAHVHARGACPCMCSSSLWLSHSCAFAAMSHNQTRRLLED